MLVLVLTKSFSFPWFLADEAGAAALERVVKFYFSLFFNQFLSMLITFLSKKVKCLKLVKTWAPVLLQHSSLSSFFFDWWLLTKQLPGLDLTACSVSKHISPVIFHCFPRVLQPQSDLRSASDPSPRARVLLCTEETTSKSIKYKYSPRGSGGVQATVFIMIHHSLLHVPLQAPGQRSRLRLVFGSICITRETHPAAVSSTFYDKIWPLSLNPKL